ncbi:MAG: PHP domain-containing protein [Dehalococcoidales bacterium]
MHTEYSKDCEMSLETIIERCRGAELECVTISDHGTVEGALKLQAIAPFKVIVAEEILTPDGELMGMFLKETIPSHISIEEAISRIKEQGGLVCLPHPFDPFRGIKLNNSKLTELAGQLDVIEVFNARSPLPGPETRARKFAASHNLPCTAGSDSHTPKEIGRTYVEMPDFNDKDDFLGALRQGSILQHRSSPFVHVATTWTKIKNLF